MDKIEKVKKLVKIRTTEGRAISGYVFLLANERLSDLINQERLFIPVEKENEIEMLNKHHIISILERKGRK